MKKIERIGEKGIATNGMSMKIYNYRSSVDLDVEFDDGTIVEHQSYWCFKKGWIKYPGEKRIGETSTAYNGQIMTLIAYRDSRHVDVQFEDGTIVKNKRYNTFKTGEIRNPNKTLFRKIKDRTGVSKIAANGQKMTIIAYRKNDDIDVQFEDGTIVTGKTYKAFDKGSIKNPNFSK